MKTCPQCGYTEPTQETYIDLSCQHPETIKTKLYPSPTHPDSFHSYYNPTKHGKLGVVFHGSQQTTHQFWQASNGGLGFWTFPNSYPKTRAEIRLSAIRDYPHLQMDKTVFLSYDMSIHTMTRMLKDTNFIHLTQVWAQDCGTKVPFTFTMWRDTYDNYFKYKMVARTRTRSIQFGSGMLVHDWTNFIFEFYPSLDPNQGLINIWIDEDLRHTHKGAWGFDRTTSPNPKQLDVRCGAYGVNPESNTCLFFDNIKLTNFKE